MYDKMHVVIYIVNTLCNIYMTR